MRIIFKKRAGDTSLINKRLTLDVENPDLLKKIEFFTVYGGHFGYCRRFGVADREREPLAPLGCYIYSIALCGSFPGRSVLSVLPDLLEGSRKF